MLLLLATLLSFRFESADIGLPRSGQWRHGFAVADMNGDGAPDLVFPSARKQAGPPVIFLNDRNGKWHRWTEARFPARHFDYGAVGAADFDGNGTNDIVLGAHYRGVVALLNDGKGNFTISEEGLGYPQTRTETAKFSSRAVVPIDWNRDGKMDFAALSDGPRPLTSGTLLGVTIFENLGTSWRPIRASGDVVFGDAIATGDVDGDALPDLVTASHNPNDRRVLRLGSDVDLKRRELETLLTAKLVRAADLGDFDGDGRDEIVLGYAAATDPAQSSIELLAYPAGSRPPQQLWTEAGEEVGAIAVGDLDGDGARDAVAALGDGRLLTFRGNGRGTLVRDADIAVPEWRRGCTAYGLRVADLNGDARDEVIAGFAGESAGCTSGGGIEVWSTAIVKGSQRSRAVRH